MKLHVFINSKREILVMKAIAILCTGATALFLSSLSFTANAGATAGKALHEEANCIRCHAAQPYDPAKTTNFEKLVSTVESCSNNLGVGWFDDEIEQVAAYLNQEFYKFK